MVSVEFSVVGESIEDPGHILLVDEERQFYDYDLVAGVITPVEVDESWIVDAELTLPRLSESERRLLLAS